MKNDHQIFMARIRQQKMCSNDLGLPLYRSLNRPLLEPRCGGHKVKTWVKYLRDHGLQRMEFTSNLTCTFAQEVEVVICLCQCTSNYLAFVCAIAHVIQSIHPHQHILLKRYFASHRCMHDQVPIIRGT